AAARRADHQDVALLKFHPIHVRLVDALVVVIDSHRKRLFSDRLPDYISVEEIDDLLWLRDSFPPKTVARPAMLDNRSCRLRDGFLGLVVENVVAEVDAIRAHRPM